MSASAARFGLLDTFRGVWVRGHLDYQRAVEALDVATQSEEEARLKASTAIDDDEMRRTQQGVEQARQRVAEIEARLESQFDRFCGVP
jgi:hypothetical protein